MLRTVSTVRPVTSRTRARTSTGLCPRVVADQPTMECDHLGCFSAFCVERLLEYGKCAWVYRAEVTMQLFEGTKKDKGCLKTWCWRNCFARPCKTEVRICSFCCYGGILKCFVFKKYLTNCNSVYMITSGSYQHYWWYIQYCIYYDNVPVLIKKLDGCPFCFIDLSLKNKHKKQHK